MSLYKNTLGESHFNNPSLFSKMNTQFLFIILTLITISLMNFYSITHAPAEKMSSLFWTHGFWILTGLIIFFIVSFLDYRFFCRFSYFFYGCNLVFLTAVLFFGKVSHGAQRWFDFGWFSYQPAETMKIALILLLSHLFSQKSVHSTYGVKQIILPVLLTVIPMSLIIYQPDLGTALLIGIQGATIALFLRIKGKLLISFLMLILIFAPALWTFVLKDYQKSRVLMFISSHKDPQGAGYNTIQSKIAVGSGQLFGKGFKKGTQAQLEFLPERHTDFVFSVLSEEQGFAGSLLTVCIFLLLILKIFEIASQSRDKVGAYLCIGCLSIIFWHIFINIGMAIGILPIVGVPLPLLSYGGSNMITTFIALGLVSSVSRKRYVYS